MRSCINSITRMGDHRYEVVFDVDGRQLATMCTVSRHEGFPLVTAFPEITTTVGIYPRLIYAAVAAVDEAVGVN